MYSKRENQKQRAELQGVPSGTGTEQPWAYRAAPQGYSTTLGVPSRD